MTIPSASGPAFSTLPLSSSLQATIAAQGFEALTPIQAAAIPLLLSGRDLLGQSQTGSGKTLAFLVPILEQIDASRQVQALILCPTRELVTQVTTECRRLGRHLVGLRVLAVSGGQPFGPEARSLEEGAHVVVGTPGRLLDHLRRKTLDPVAVRVVVLDEADRMLEMGFRDEMEAIREELPTPRQTILFSATFPEGIDALSTRWQEDPARVAVEAEAVAEIREVAWEAVDKRLALRRLLREQRPDAALVFCNQKATVRDVVAALSADGFSVAGLHGDLEQEERNDVLARLRNQSLRVVVATDVAARGLDIAGLDLVVNYDLPTQTEIYVHRVGRTGRAGAPGLAVSLHTPREKTKLEWIREERGKEIERRLFSPEEAAADELRPGEKPSGDLLAPMVTLRVAGGRKDKLRPGDILGALTGEAGMAAAQIGKIEIQERTSYVAIAREHGKIARKRLAEGRIKGRRFFVEEVG